MGAKPSSLQALLSLLFPQTGDNINVTVNNHNNFQTKQEKPAPQKPPSISHLTSKSIHKGYSFLAGLGLSYVGLYFYLLHLAHELSKGTCWSLWKRDITLKSLQETQDEITQELLLSIQKNYTSYENPMDFFTPLATFLKDIEKEEQYLQRYLRLVSSVKQLRLRQFFSIDEKIVQDIPSRLERIAYLKNLFLNWTASYKLHYKPSELLTTARDMKNVVIK